MGGSSKLVKRRMTQPLFAFRFRVAVLYQEYFKNLVQPNNPMLLKYAKYKREKNGENDSFSRYFEVDGLLAIYAKIQQVDMSICPDQESLAFKNSKFICVIAHVFSGWIDCHYPLQV